MPRKLFSIEDELGVATNFSHQVLRQIATLADLAERVRNRLQLLMTTYLRVGAAAVLLSVRRRWPEQPGHQTGRNGSADNLHQNKSGGILGCDPAEGIRQAARDGYGRVGK